MADKNGNIIAARSALLGLFDGEIDIRETETVKEFKRYLKVKRMSNQKYLKNEILLIEE